MSDTQISCGELITSLLESYGVNTVFGIPGVHTLELYRGLNGSNIRHVLPRHEQGAGFMADGYARLTGKPGVCFVITGPGLTNAATAIGQAYSDSIPMLVISSVNESNSLGKGWGHLHECQDQLSLTAPITAFNATALSAEEIPGLIAKAFGIFNSQRPRPVHLEIPLDVLAQKVSASLARDVRPLPQYPRADQKDVVSAAELLGKAENPIIIAGRGALKAGTKLAEIAEKTQATVFTTVGAKGLIPDNHPLHAGATLCLPTGWDYVEKADIILAVGTELAETDFWRLKLPMTGKLIRVDIDAQKLVDLYPAELPILGDAGDFCQRLAEALPPAPADKTREENVSAFRQQCLNGYDELQKTHLAVLKAIQAGLPEKHFFATDMTQIAYTGNFAAQINQAGSWLHPIGYGTLGYALPAAIGGAAGDPNQVAIALAGDGGVLYTLTELATAVEEISSPLILIVWNNHALGQIRDDMVASGIQEIAVKPKAPDFPKLAEGFGAQSEKPTSLAALTDSVSNASRHPGVTLIEVTEACANRVGE